MAVFWDKQTIGPNASVSADGLTGTTYATGTIRATEGKRTGKWFWEVTYTGGYYPMIGAIGEAGGVGFSHSSPYCRYYYFNGAKYPGAYGYGAAYTFEDTIGVLLNMDSGEISFYKNGVPQGIAYNNLKELGLVYAAINGGSSSYTMIGTANFGAKPFKFLPNDLPEGTYSYDGLINLTTINKTLILHNESYKKWKERKPAKEGSNILPKFTSNTNGNMIVSSNSTYQSYHPYLALDNNKDTYWLSDGVPSASSPFWLTIDLGEPMTLTGYGISIVSPTTYNIGTHYFQGSNDGVNFETIHSRINQSLATTLTYIKFPATKFRYYRVYITKYSGSSGRVSIQELELIGEGTPAEERSWITLSPIIPNSDQFLEQGMDTASTLLKRLVTELEPAVMTSKSGILAKGEVDKVSSKTIDLKKYFDIKSIRTEVK